MSGPYRTVPWSVVDGAAFHFLGIEEESFWKNRNRTRSFFFASNANWDGQTDGMDMDRRGYDVCVRSRNLLLRETELLSHECGVMSLFCDCL